MKQNIIISFFSELNTVGFIDNNQTQAFANFIWTELDMFPGPASMNLW